MSVTAPLQAAVRVHADALYYRDEIREAAKRKPVLVDLYGLFWSIPSDKIFPRTILASQSILHPVAKIWKLFWLRLCSPLGSYFFTNWICSYLSSLPNRLPIRMRKRAADKSQTSLWKRLKSFWLCQMNLRQLQVSSDKVLTKKKLYLKIRKNNKNTARSGKLEFRQKIKKHKLERKFALTCSCNPPYAKRSKGHRHALFELGKFHFFPPCFIIFIAHHF